MTRLYFLGSLLCCSGLLAAQSSDPADSTIWKDITLEDVVVTAQYAPSHPSRAVHQVRVIEALDIQQQGLNNLAEVLTNQLNLRVSSDPFLGNGLRIQGIGGENVQLLGVPIAVAQLFQGVLLVAVLASDVLVRYRVVRVGQLRGEAQT